MYAFFLPGLKSSCHGNSDLHLGVFWFFLPILSLSKYLRLCTKVQVKTSTSLHNDSKAKTVTEMLTFTHTNTHTHAYTKTHSHVNRVTCPKICWCHKTYHIWNNLLWNIWSIFRLSKVCQHKWWLAANRLSVQHSIPCQHLLLGRLWNNPLHLHIRMHSWQWLTLLTFWILCHKLIGANHKCSLSTAKSSIHHPYIYICMPE